MTIGIIGANGFIGRNLCLKYIEQGEDVYAFYNNNFENISNKCRLIPPDQLTPDFLDVLFISIGNYYSDYSKAIEQISLLQQVINKLHYRKVIFISSTAVYGNHSSVINKNSCYCNPNIYGQSKLAQEFIIKSCTNFAIIRPTYIYGSGMNRNSLIPIWLHDASKNKKITVFGDGSRKQDYIHIDDLTEICSLVARDNENSTTLVATGKSITNLELAKTIQKYFPDTIIQFQGHDNGYSFEYNIDDTIKNYNWEPKYSIDIWMNNLIGNENFNL